MDDLETRLRGLDTYGYQSQLACEAADRIAALEAEVERRGKALDEAWAYATAMRNSAKTVGAYPSDPAANKVYHRARYHDGKRMMEILRPARAALGPTP